MSSHVITSELKAARMAALLSQEALAQRAGLSRMTVQRIEAGQIDPRLSTLQEMFRALGLELMPVPTALRPQLEDFVRSGGRLLGQPPGVGAPPSIAQVLADK
jgi:transcriptional regulator with XRE-family HTH domain